MSAKEKANALIETFKAKIKAKPEGTADWGGYLIFSFSDADVSYLIKFAMDGTVEKVEAGTLETLKQKQKLATALLTTTDILEAVWNGDLPGIGAFSGGGIKIQGSMDDIMKVKDAFMD